MLGQATVAAGMRVMAGSLSAVATAPNPAPPVRAASLTVLTVSSFAVAAAASFAVAAAASLARSIRVGPVGIEQE